MHFINALFWLVILRYVKSSNILMMTMGGTQSHKVPFIALAKGLIPRGHTVTFVSGFRGDSKLPGLIEVTPQKLANYIHNYTDWDLVGNRMSSRFPVSFLKILRYPHEACEAMISDVKMKDILSQKFDLAILDGAFLTCAVGIVHRLRVPFMHINTVAFYTLSLSASGNPVPYSISPNLLSSYSDTLSLHERTQNALMHLIINGFYLFSTARVHTVLKRHLGTDIPHPIVLSREASIILHNGHPSLTYARPLNPNVIEIACIHCLAASALPRDLEEFVSSNNSKGFIYFSMGSSVKSANIPEKFLQILLAVFSQVPYQVLWKYDGTLTDMGCLPENIKLSKWLPQQDILGHKNIKAFVTHGGLLSMFEAVYHGVPMVMMPVFCDHDLNTAKAVNDGIAVRVLLESVTTKELFKAIVDVAESTSFRNAIRQKQQILRDQMADPLEKAIFWTEYVLRYNGAEHLKSPSRLMGWIEYYLIDVAAICGLVIVLGIVLVKSLFRIKQKV